MPSDEAQVASIREYVASVGGRAVAVTLGGHGALPRLWARAGGALVGLPELDDMPSSHVVVLGELDDVVAAWPKLVAAIGGRTAVLSDDAWVAVDELAAPFPVLCATADPDPAALVRLTAELMLTCCGEAADPTAFAARWPVPPSRWTVRPREAIALTKPLDVAVAVVGDGIVGAFVIAELLRAGLRPDTVAWVGDDVGWARSSATRYSGGLVRCGMADEVSGELATEAFVSTWRGHPQLRSVGSVTLVSADEAARARTRVASLRRSGIDCELVSASDVVPEVRWAPEDLALVEPAAGYASPWRVRSALVRDAERAGVTLRAAAPVTRVRDELDTVVVETAGSRVVAGSVVIAAGRSTRALAGSWAIPGAAREIGYAYFDGLLPRGLPTVDDATRGLWWRPAPTGSRPGRVLVGRAVDRPSDALVRRASWRSQERYVREGLVGLIEHPEAGRYLGGVRSFDVRPEGGVVGEWARSPSGRVAAVSGLDGGGFKLAPALARRMVRSFILEGEL